jgi:hypothetical protein
MGEALLLPALLGSSLTSSARGQIFTREKQMETAEIENAKTFAAIMCAPDYRFFEDKPIGFRIKSPYSEANFDIVLTEKEVVDGFMVSATVKLVKNYKDAAE